jgi:glycosyltransferase involved in cell wall biosynthesis
MSPNESTPRAQGSPVRCETVSIVIATRNRPDDLYQALRHILAQSEKPLQVVIVDDGDLGGPPLAADFQAAGIELAYLQKDDPGLTKSRNLGLDRCRGDVVLFLDDDGFIGPGFLAGLRAHYQSPEVLGVGARAHNEVCRDLKCRARLQVNRLGLISGWREGRMLPSGFYTNFGETGRDRPAVCQVQFLSGYAMSYRREVFQRHRFDEVQFAKYSYGEDKDFSLRVARDGQLLLDRRLDFFHNRAAVSRPNLEQTGYMFVVSRFLLLRRHLDARVWNYVLFAYALTYYFLLRSLIALVKFRVPAERSRLLGILRGVRAIARGDLRVGYR